MNSPLEIVQVGKGSLLNINWELVSHCQFKCTYCYYKPHTSDLDYSAISKIVLKKLSLITDPFKITLIGGEPSLHPDFHNVISSLYQIKNAKEINIVTNFEKDQLFWEKLLPFKDKVKIVVSFHPEYPQKDAFLKISNLSTSMTFDCVFIAHNNLKFLPKLREYQKNIIDYFPLDLPFNFVPLHYKEKDENQYFTYPKEIQIFLEEMHSLSLSRGHYEKVELLTNKWSSISKFDFLKYGMNKLKGWSCDLRAFIIHKDGMVSRSCTNSKRHILLEKFEPRTISCPYNICECDDYWNFPKTKVN